MKKIFGKLSGKGFAAAVALCLLVVCGAGIYSYNKISDGINDKLIKQNSVTLPAVTEKPSELPANAEQTQIAKEETTAASESQTEASEKTADAEAELGGVSLEESVPQTMVRPLNGEVVGAFSGGELVKSSTLNVWKTHDGVDIAGTEGEKVKSMSGGKVTKIYEDSMWGACVIIDHGNGLEGYYCSLGKDIPVVEGQTVSAGTIIGSVGNTAEAEIKEASHLHFGVKKNGEWIDPISLISGEGS